MDLTNLDPQTLFLLRTFTPYVLAGILVTAVFLTGLSFVKPAELTGLALLFSAIAFMTWFWTAQTWNQSLNLRPEALFVGWVVALLLTLVAYARMTIAARKTKTG